MIPASAVASIAVTGPACGPAAMVEPLSMQVQENIQVANTLVNASKTCFHIQVVNPTSRDVWLKPRTRLGTAHGAVTVNRGNQIELDVHCNEVIISCPVEAENQEFPSQEPDQPAAPLREEDLPAGISLTDFPVTSAEKQEALRIFTSHANVFARDGEDLGCTTTVQHSILTSDDIPVFQRHTRIPPSHLREVKQHLQELLDKGVIAPSQSSYASPTDCASQEKELCPAYVRGPPPPECQGKTRCLSPAKN